MASASSWIIIGGLFVLVAMVVAYLTTSADKSYMSGGDPGKDAPKAKRTAKTH